MADLHSDSEPRRGAPLFAERFYVVGGRWLIVLAFLNVLALSWIWLVRDGMRQEKLIYSTITVGSSAILVLLWVTICSRLSGKTTLAILGVLLLALLLVATTLCIEGVSGDLVPVVTWRWKPKSDTTLITLRAQRDAVSDDDQTQNLSGLRDFSQFLGPQRNATLSGINLARDWSEQPPRLVWRRPIGAGWSGFAVAGRHCVTQEQRGADELVVCYDLITAQVLWSQAIPARYESTLAGIGPRATPTIDTDQVFTLGATGVLQCLDLATGRRNWSINILEHNNAELNEWGMSGSPLIMDQFVIVNAGGPNGHSLVAYDRSSGQRTWSAGDDRATYSSPLVAELAGLRQIVVFNQTTIAGHDPSEGRMLWSYDWPGNLPKVAQPVVLPANRLFVTSSYGVGCALIQIRMEDTGSLTATGVWENLHLKAKFTNVVYRDGCIFGLDEAILTCLEVETGRRRWKRGRYGHGQLLLVDDLLLVQAESGQIILLEASPDQHHELAQFQAIEGKTWNSPTLAGRFLLVRNDRVAACYELSAEE